MEILTIILIGILLLIIAILVAQIYLHRPQLFSGGVDNKPTETYDKYTLHVQEPWYSLIKSGKKKIEGRKFTRDWEIGEYIKFYDKNDSYWVKIVDIRKYKTLVDYLTAEGFEKALPGVKTFDEAVKIYEQWAKPEDVKRHGFCAYEVEVLKNPVEEQNSYGLAIISKSKVLLVNTPDGKYWGFPKGHIDKGEDGKTAAIRETEEEIGIKVKPSEIIAGPFYVNKIISFTPEKLQLMQEKWSKERKNEPQRYTHSNNILVRNGYFIAEQNNLDVTKVQKSSEVGESRLVSWDEAAKLMKSSDQLPVLLRMQKWYN